MTKFDDDEIIDTIEQMRWAQRRTEARRDPWIPASEIAAFSEYAIGLIELMGNDAANEIMREAVITALGRNAYKEIRARWSTSGDCMIDMCRQALIDAGKEVP